MPFDLKLFATVVVFATMLFELRLSGANERALRARGAVEPRDDVYRAMAWSYPASFLAMGLEGAFGPSPGRTMVLGLLVFAMAKAIKYWAIASLGPRWTFRVLVLPHAPLVTRGPYAWLRHPNYVGVVGELLGFALIVSAPITGVLSVVGFGLLLRRRIAIEDRALRRANGDQHAQRGV